MVATAGCRPSSKPPTQAGAAGVPVAAAPADLAVPLPPTAAPAPPPQAADAESWLAALRAASPGKDLGIVCDATGTWAWVEGRRVEVDPNKGSWCVVDPLAEVIWMAAGAQVFIIDLHAPKLARSSVVEGWPTEDKTARPVAIDYGGFPRRFGNASHNDEFSVTIEMATGTTRLAGGNFEFNIGDKQLETLARQVKVVDGKLLERLAARAATRSMPEPPVSSCSKLIPGLPQACEGVACGTTEPVPNTPYCRVLISQSCGDGCYLDYALYDAATKRFLYGYAPGGDSPSAPFGTGATLRVSPSGRHVIASGVISDWKGKLVASGASGWLGLGHALHGD